MHSRSFLLLVSLFTLFASHVQASPARRRFCVGSPNAIFKISNFAFQKTVSVSPAVSPSCSVFFNFADIYHGSSTTCSARYDNCGGIKNVVEPELNPGGIFDGLKLFDCDNGVDTQFRFWEKGRLDLVHRWTCDTPGDAPSQHFAATSSGQVPGNCTKSSRENDSETEFSCKSTSDWWPESTMIKPS
ncbi:Prohibitin-2 [Venturia nashicola]|uniref:Prohibitin-2 n=1 Tax=Venturia nashicola TaxID=86259 RepID=A0A4Z1NFQ8_9PEZI|nr:Prohibitin-2 [Venturia nashicola]TLD20087.1 Prohibitin-2 [Venturia nashicola]